MDKDRLPPKLGATLVEYLEPMLERVPSEILLIALLTKIAQVVNLNRSKISSKVIKGGDNTMQPTVYSIFFASSGIGKDRTIGVFDNEILVPIKQDFLDRYNNRKGSIYSEAEKEATQQGLTPSQTVTFINQSTPHDFRWKISHGTLEGLLSFAESIQQAGCGCLYYENPELLDLLQRRDENALLFIQTLKTFYASEAISKLIKGDKTSVEIKNCPTVMLAWSAIEGVQQEEIKQKIVELFGRGFARRSFVVLESLSKKRIIDHGKDILSHQQKVEQSTNRALGLIQEYFLEVYNETKGINKAFIFSQDADRAILEYEQLCLNRATIPGMTGKIINSELSGRHWKAMQVAGLIAMFERPGEKTVELIDVDTAIYLVELFGTHIESFFTDLDSPEEERFYKYLKSNINKPISRMDLRKQKFVYKDNFLKWLLGAIETIQPLAYADGYEIVEDNNSKQKTITLVDPARLEIQKEDEIKQYFKKSLEKGTSKIEVMGEMMTINNGVLDFEKLEELEQWYDNGVLGKEIDKLTQSLKK